jgi:monoamine oxidase
LKRLTGGMDVWPQAIRPKGGRVTKTRENMLHLPAAQED